MVPGFEASLIRQTYSFFFLNLDFICMRVPELVLWQLIIICLTKPILLDRTWSPPRPLYIFLRQGYYQRKMFNLVITVVCPEEPSGEGSHRMETNPLICSADRLTGFHMMFVFAERYFRAVHNVAIVWSISGYVKITVINNYSSFKSIFSLLLLPNV